MFELDDEPDGFQKGDIVECIDDGPNPSGHYVNIRIGRKYTVENFDGEHLHLVEIDGGWKPKRFKKCMT